MNKKLKKLLGREFSPLELLTLLLAIPTSLLTIIGSLNYFGIVNFQIPFFSKGGYAPLILGIALILVVFWFLKNKRKDILLQTIIIIITLLLIARTAMPLTTVFSADGMNRPTESYEECVGVSGMLIPLNQDCPAGSVEIGNAGEYFVCCIEDTCEGEWRRIYNYELRLFEKKCITE